jgi:hypothetical protein
MLLEFNRGMLVTTMRTRTAQVERDWSLPKETPSCPR